jgi:hypothetical protein
MSYRQRKPQSRSPVPRQPEEFEGLPRSSDSTPAMSTTLDSVQISPRNHHTIRQNHLDAEEEVEMSLLEEDDRRLAAAGFVDGNGHLEAKHKVPLSAEDKRAMTLLCVLCTWLFSPLLTQTMNPVTRRSHPGCSCTYQPSPSALSFALTTLCSSVWPWVRTRILFQLSPRANNGLGDQALFLSSFASIYPTPSSRCSHSLLTHIPSSCFGHPSSTPSTFLLLVAGSHGLYPCKPSSVP